MSITLEYRAGSVPDGRSPKQRYEAALARHKAQRLIDARDCGPRPQRKFFRPGQSGVFTFAATDLDTLIGLIECDMARLQMGRSSYLLSQRWHEDWTFIRAEFFTRVRTGLQALRSREEFNWVLFEPVYRRNSFAGINLAALVAWLLENDQTENKCDVCGCDCALSDVQIFDWSWSHQTTGGEYVCPRGHCLLETDAPYIGSPATGEPRRRWKRVPYNEHPKPHYLTLAELDGPL